MMTQPEQEAKLEELEQRVARLEALNNIPPKPIGPTRFKTKDVIPLVDEGKEI